MRTCLVSCCILLGLSGAAAAECPAPSDMSRGVEVTTVSPRGEQNVFTFRKVGSGQVDEVRTSQWISVSNTVQRRLIQGLVPSDQKVLKAPQDSQVLKDETYAYPGQKLTALQLKPNSQFTLKAVMTAEDGFSKTTRTTYLLGPAKKQRFLGCVLEMMPIEAIEDWGGSLTVYNYLYFTRLGFGVQTEAKFPGKTYSRKIMEIGPAVK